LKDEKEGKKKERNEDEKNVQMIEQRRKEG
jgi:hypothetical protein